MKKYLYRSPSIQVRESRLHGYGVFAARDIPKGEPVEECPYFNPSSSSQIWEDKMVRDYVFTKGVSQEVPLQEISGNEELFEVIDGIVEGKNREASFPLGSAMIFNHSKDPNISYEIDLEDKFYLFYTIKPVWCDEELCHDYNNNWSKNFDKENG